MDGDDFAGFGAAPAVPAFEASAFAAPASHTPAPGSPPFEAPSFETPSPAPLAGSGDFAEPISGEPEFSPAPAASLVRALASSPVLGAPFGAAPSAAPTLPSGAREGVVDFLASNTFEPVELPAAETEVVSSSGDSADSNQSADMVSLGGSGSTLSNSGSLVSAASTLSGDSTNYDMARVGGPSAMVTEPPPPPSDDFDDFGGFGDAPAPAAPLGGSLGDFGGFGDAPAAAAAPTAPLDESFGDFGFDDAPAPSSPRPPA